MLKPRGHFFFNVWDRISTNEFADVVTEALADALSGNRRDFWPDPHGYYNLEKIREELTAAGFANVTIETVDHTGSRAASAREPAIAYCQGTPLRNEIEARDASRLEAGDGGRV